MLSTKRDDESQIALVLEFFMLHLRTMSAENIGLIAGFGAEMLAAQHDNGSRSPFEEDTEWDRRLDYFSSAPRVRASMTR